jgi:hypothetical protein
MNEKVEVGSKCRSMADVTEMRSNITRLVLIHVVHVTSATNEYMVLYIIVFSLTEQV